MTGYETENRSLFRHGWTLLVSFAAWTLAATVAEVALFLWKNPAYKGLPSHIHEMARWGLLIYGSLFLVSHLLAAVSLMIWRGGSARDLLREIQRFTAFALAAWAIAWLPRAGSILGASGRSFKGLVVSAVLILVALFFSSAVARSIFQILRRLAFASQLPVPVMILIVSLVTGGVTLLRLGGEQITESETQGEHPNIVLILIDALRADYLASYGSSEARTPALDRLAREGTVFSTSSSQAPYTLWSVASLFTSRYPGETVRESRSVADDLTLTQELRRHGYQTAGFVRNSHLEPPFGFHQGFDDYDVGYEQPLRDLKVAAFLKGLGWIRDQRRADYREINQLAVPWIENKSEDPFFLYLHYIEPHRPYRPPFVRRIAKDLSYRGKIHQTFMDLMEGLLKGNPSHVSAIIVDEEDREFLKALYRAEVEDVDRRVSEILRTLDEQGDLENSVVVVLSDHGEEFNDHGLLDHGLSLYDELLRVPLLIRFPSVVPADQAVSEPVSLIDVAPTLFELAGIPAPTSFRGESLSPFFAPGGNFQRSIYSEMDAQGRKFYSWREGSWKLIHTLEGKRGRSRGSLELYNLDADPGERTDLSQAREDLVRELGVKLRDQVERVEESAASVSESQGKSDGEGDSTRERLRALGYVN